MKRKFIEIGVILVTIFSMVFLYFYHKNVSQKTTITVSTTESAKEIKARDGIKGVSQPWPFITSKAGVENNIFQNTNNNIAGQFIYLQRDRLPEAEQKLFANNKDTTQFILGYLSGQKAADFEYGQSVELERKYPYYIQWDRRWGYNTLGGTNIAIGGCGPTTVAMALGGMLNDNTITPDKIAKIEDENGYFTDAGTSWSFFDFIAKEYGLQSSGVSLSKGAMDAALDRGNPIIVSVHPGKFTTVGHIVLITAKDSDGKYIINDPNSYTRTLKKWSFDELKTEIVAMWEFSK